MTQKIEQDWGQGPLVVAVIPAGTPFKAAFTVTSSVDQPGWCRVEMDETGVKDKICLPSALNVGVSLETDDNKLSGFVFIEIDPKDLGDGHVTGWIEIQD